MTHYIHDEKNNRIEGMSKEEIYALLAEAIQTGQLPSVDEDTAFVTMFKSIVDGKTYKMAFCTQAQYNQLEAQGLLVADAYYIITDDTTYDDIINYIDTQIASMTTKVDKESILGNKGINLSNENGVFQIRGYNNTDELVVILKFDGDASPQLYVEDYYGTVIETYNLLTVLGQVATKNITVQNNEAIITQAGLYKVTCQSASSTNYRYTTMLSVDDLSVLDGGGQYYSGIRYNDTAEIRATKSGQTYIINRTSTAYNIIDIKLIVKY